MRRDPTFLLLLTCFILSGLAGLVYQTAWTWEFALVFGTSELAVAAVLAAYMGGLAVGAIVIERRIDRVRRPVVVYGLLELGIGVAALLVPLALKLAARLQTVLLGGLDLPPTAGSLGSSIFYLATAFLVLLPPTAMMGATLPLLARSAVARDDDISRRTGLLYTANTLGAAAGALTSAFVLLPRFGLDPTVWTAIALNFLVFALAVLLERIPRPETATVLETPETPEAKNDLAIGRWVLPLIFVSGALALSWEVLWTRLLGHLLGGSVYAFGTMLATFLCGIALGSAVAGAWATTRTRAHTGFVLAQLSAAAASYLAFLAAAQLPEFFAGRLGLAGGTRLGPAAGVAGLTLLPGALFFGASFPFAVRLLADRAEQVGRASARVLAWNTAGAIVGAVAAGFFLLPALGFAAAAHCAVAVGLLSALVAALCEQKRRSLAAATIVGLILLFLFPPATPWDVLRTSPLTGQAASGKVLFHAVGRSSTVLVTESPREIRLTTNGLPESVIETPGARLAKLSIARWLALLPTAVRPEIDSACLIGLGAGITLESFAPTIRDVQLIELEQEVLNANRFLIDQRRSDPTADPRVRIAVHDARSALALSTRRFGAIVSQPSHPWTPGASHLFTSEFFALVAERLEDDGVFVQWIGARFVDEALLRSLTATLLDVFPYVELYQPPPGGGLLFAASREPLDLDASKQAGFEAAQDSWRELGVLTPDDLLPARALDVDGARAFSAPPRSTDRRNQLRIRSPRAFAEGGLDATDFARSTAAYDPLVGRRDLYLLRRLIAMNSLTRAQRFTAAWEDPNRRRIGEALIDLQESSGKKGRDVLLDALDASDPEIATAALAALVEVSREDLFRGRTDPRLTAATREHPDASMILDGWRRLQLREQALLAEFDPLLEAIDSRNPFFEAAVRLRIALRRADGDPQRLREAASMIDPLLAATAAKGVDLILRARLGIETGDRGLTLNSLQDLDALLARAPNQRIAKVADELRRQAQQI